MQRSHITTTVTTGTLSDAYIEALKHKVTAYAKKLIAASNTVETKVVNKQYNHESLAGIFSDDWSEDELRNEYLHDKFGI